MLRPVMVRFPSIMKMEMRMPIQISQNTQVLELQKKVFSEFWKWFPEMHEQQLKNRSQVVKHGTYKDVCLTRVYQEEGKEKIVPLTRNEQIEQLWNSSHKGEIYATFNRPFRER